MLRILIAKHNAKTVIVNRLCFQRERVVFPTGVTRNQIGSEPAPDEITAAAPDVAALMQPSIRLDSPVRRPFDRVGIINNSPVDQTRIVEPLVQQHSVRTAAKHDRGCAKNSVCENANEKGEK